MITKDELEKMFETLATNGDSYNYNILMLYKKLFVNTVSELLEKEYTRGFLEGATHERTYKK